MSDAPAEGKKKKGGKMPIIIALVAVVAAGGFFAMKGKGGKEKPKVPEAELGAVMSAGDEFIVNLRQREIFVRAKIALQLDKAAHIEAGGGGHEGGGGESTETQVIRDAIIMRLNSLTLDDISKPEFYKKLKMAIAEDINSALHALEPAEPKEEEKPKKGSKKEKEEPKAEEPQHVIAPGDLDHIVPGDLEHKDWDSDEGPVLKVYFTEFATMRE